jgi:hypothetical protein
MICPRVRRRIESLGVEFRPPTVMPLEEVDRLRDDINAGRYKEEHYIFKDF